MKQNTAMPETYELPTETCNTACRIQAMSPNLLNY